MEPDERRRARTRVGRAARPQARLDPPWRPCRKAGAERSGRLLEGLRFNAAMERGTAPVLRQFLREHPDGAHREEAEIGAAEAQGEAQRLGLARDDVGPLPARRFEKRLRQEFRPVRRTRVVWRNLPPAFAWVGTLLGGAQVVRFFHHVLTWFWPIFLPLHIYLTVRADVVHQESRISSMVGGGRYVRSDIEFIDD